MTTKAPIGINVATDTINAAIVEHEAEIARVYGWINNLYKMQAQATAPTDNSPNDLWLSTATDPPVLYYYTGSTWASLVNASAYDSGLSYQQTLKGYSKNAILTIDGTSVTIVGTFAAPITVEAQGKMLQVAADVSYSFVGVAAGTYYLYPVRTGATTAFTLERSDTVIANENTLGVVVLSAEATIASVTSYEEPDVPTQREAQKVVKQFGVYLAAGVTIADAETRIPYATTLTGWPVNADMDLVTNPGRFTPNLAGWYRMKVSCRADAAKAHNILFKKSGTTVSRHREGNAQTTFECDTTVYLNGTTDYFEVFADPGSAYDTDGAVEMDNSFTGYWIGDTE